MKPINKMTLIFTLVFLLLIVNSCKDSKSSPVSSVTNVVWKKGDCLDTVLSPHILQVVDVEKGMVRLFKMGEMGKKVFTKSKQKLLSDEAPYKKVVCP